MYKATIALCCISIMLFTGCGSSPKKPVSVAMQVDPSLHTVSKSDYSNSNKPIELPQNYSTRNYKRLVVSAYFFPEEKTGYSNLPVENLSTRLETELSKLKRFTIVSRHLGQKGKMAEKAFQDMGTTKRSTKMRFGKGMNADYSLSGGVTATKEEYERTGQNEVLYIVRIDYQLVDNETDEIIEADTAEGRAKRTLIRLPSGRIISGFDPNNKKNQKDVVDQAGINALRVVANKLGNKLPIGGKVIGFKGSRFQLDKGHNEGFMGKQIVTLYTSDMGIDLAFAVAEVTPGNHQTPGKIIRWSSDPDVQDVIEGIKSDRLYFKKYDLYGVSNGMPTPPEWEKNYRD